jgi:hypothetical protein
MPKKRNYRQEYDRYQGTEAQKKRRASRNAANAKARKAGKLKKGDGRDAAHKNGNPKDNRSKNITAQSKTKNRSYARTKKAGKKNAKS